MIDTSVDMAASLGAALDRVGDRWSLAVLCAINAGETRFNELQRAISASRASLASCLRRLEQCGLITRQQYQVSPVRWDYLLTQEGQTLVPICSVLAQWAANGLPATRR